MFPSLSPGIEHSAVTRGKVPIIHSSIPCRSISIPCFSPSRRNAPASASSFPFIMQAPILGNAWIPSCPRPSRTGRPSALTTALPTKVRHCWTNARPWTPRFKVVHQQNGGVSNARNRGLEHIRAPYLLLVDSDDWLGSGRSGTVIRLHPGKWRRPGHFRPLLS